MNHYKLISKSEIQGMIDSLGKQFTNAKQALSEIESNPLWKVSKCLQAFSKAQAELENINQYTINFFRTCKSGETPDWSQERKCFGLCKPLVSKRVLINLEQQSEEDSIATVFHEAFHASEYEDNPKNYHENREDEAEEYAAKMCKKHFDFEYTPDLIAPYYTQTPYNPVEYCNYIDDEGEVKRGKFDECKGKYQVFARWNEEVA